MQTWWNSNSGILFQQEIKRATEKHFKVIPCSFSSSLIFIRTKIGINPNVIIKWKNGGNPSIINIDKILTACDSPISVRATIIDGLREIKNNKTSVSNIVELTAIINDYDEKTGKYWVRTYRGDRFIHGDRVGIYDYASKIIHTPTYRQKVINKLGHNNFIINLNLELSRPPIHS